ncbi:DNA uptake Rossmann fold nucleotide-binding protein [Novosphingobium sp. Rr 2-17]|uniref:DNA-processing protein DprA n=1 Tax=Novosphingobium sp. Rr 2-17 TaxID=555793 RepID=UPI0002699BFC|nr:DNA-processing protein DprA [Novosphingobium sp. Rr 2-17]EIZ77979.1 DNA uptake Rossmann fold nucleotide-binding protein [Novosphingobium sp. Rr 2-17]
MTIPALSPDTQATTLLVGRFGKGEAKPLTRGEYNKVAQTLHARKLRPSDLFKDVPEELPVERSRIVELIGRGTSLALAVERWGQFGVKLVSRADPDYPARFRSLLKGGGAPILFYAGDLGLLDAPTLGVVGSRDATVAGTHFAAQLGNRAVTENVVIASGDARGIDRAAMDAALDSGGRVIGILADSLAKSVLSRRYRQAIGDQRLLLISHVEPEARFSAYQAMERNRYIYTASDAVIVSDSDVKGGTWSGAIENQKHGWTPAYARVGSDVREGNAALVQHGLAPIGEDWFESGETLRSLFHKHIPSPQTLPLFEDQVEVSVSATGQGSGDELFLLFLSLLEPALETAQDTASIIQRFSLERDQATAWLNRATQLGKIKARPAGVWQWVVA